MALPALDVFIEETLQIQACQGEPVMQTTPYYQYGAAYGLEDTERMVEEMVQEGLLIRNEDGSVYLTDWENYVYHF